jgi:hypothetical protein
MQNQQFKTNIKFKQEFWATVFFFFFFFYFTLINLGTLIAQIKNLNSFRSVDLCTDKNGQVLDVRT